MVQPPPTLDRVNRWCQRHGVQVRLLSLARHSPRLIGAGPVPLAPQVRALGQQLAATLSHNEWHALVDLSTPAPGERLPYQTLRYADMLALRQCGARPTGLSATALLCARDGGQLLWQRRSASSHLFAGCVSLLGGGVVPPQAEAPGDGDDPGRAAVREVREESGLTIQLAADSWVAVTQECDTGAVQINYLGIAADFTGARADLAEGSLVYTPVPAPDQVAALAGFTDLAKACLYTWLLCDGGR